MDRVQLVLLGLPILLFCSDVVTLFAPLPPAAPKPDHQSGSTPDAFQPGDPSAADASAQAEPQVDVPGSGTTVDLKFCASCSYRGTAMTMKRMLETSFPGIHVVLENYPPPFPKRALSKAVPLLQVGAMATLMAGDQIFPRFGMVPPPWFSQNCLSRGFPVRLSYRSSSATGYWILRSSLVTGHRILRSSLVTRYQILRMRKIWKKIWS
ncbi:hypothetical protein SETIT_5G369200v2 [Setaria italica]|uniref:SelT-like protein n=1 Tax=Setaria italica TaxID=4555 RepID=A0A368RD00_SETIT|nr:hypothetical protein SETIT_5G369200v2 [Setaria italica]